MKSVNNSSFKTGLVEEDVTLSTFRKRNKILILIFISFIISLTLIIGALITYLVREDGSLSDQSVPLNPAVFYSDDCNTPSCLKIFNTIISTKSITDPNKIFTLSLQTAAKDLENLVSSILSTSGSISDGNKTVIAFKTCSGSLSVALSQIGDVLAIMRGNPFVETQSDEQRGEMMNRIMAADENLKSCLDDLGKVESTAVSEVREKVLQVKVYVSSSGDFLFGYDEVWDKFWSDIAADWDSDDVKTLPLGNALRPWSVWKQFEFFILI
ncbi:hypothetical protein Pfo_011313 [Paulownia fortunei]|nr:hypothetical protein Pfo_011313 [Paulownia fortunei]